MTPLDVRCPACGAPPQARCRTPWGTPPHGQIHRDRYDELDRRVLEIERRREARQ